MVNCCCYDIGTDIFSLEQQETAMFKNFLRKQNQVQVLILKYLEDLKMTQENFSLALESCLTDDKACGDFSFLSDETHRFESRADDVREQIKTLMYDKTLLPESRGDIMRLLDGMDYIPRYMEIILNMIKTQMLEIPDFIVADIRELLSASLESVGLMSRQVEDLFKRKGQIKELVSVIDMKESQCDRIERRLISTIFKSDLDGFLKLQLKELVIYLGEISDHVDTLSKQINIMNLKRRV
jgi:predicted phosphate transport protein (TIGR00153 family)